MLVGLSSLPLLVILTLYSHLPESPRFDLLHGNMESLHKTIEAIAKDNGKEVPKGLVRGADLRCIYARAHTETCTERERERERERDSYIYAIYHTPILCV